MAVRKMAHETFEASMKIVREWKVNQMVPQSLPVYAPAQNCTQDRERI